MRQTARIHEPSTGIRRAALPPGCCAEHLSYRGRGSLMRPMDAKCLKVEKGHVMNTISKYYKAGILLLIVATTAATLGSESPSLT